MSKDQNNILIIVGMHRSMTSLASHWLQNCGLSIGDHLYGASLGNVKGHYEDEDFIQLHKYILNSCDSNWLDTSDKTFHPDEYAVAKSKSLVKLKSSLYQQWGWKDPRTCLFLNHWEEILPSARYLIVYRSYADVVNSLVRREFKVENKVEYFVKPLKYAKKIIKLNNIKERNIKVWINYNRRILQFVERSHSEKYLIINTEQLLNCSKNIMLHITEKWGFTLNYISINSIYDADITKIGSINKMKGINKSLIHEAEYIQNQLKINSVL